MEHRTGDRVSPAFHGPRDQVLAQNQVTVTQNERALLQALLTRISNLDPDVLIAHDGYGSAFEVRSRLSAEDSHFLIDSGRRSAGLGKKTKNVAR